MREILFKAKSIATGEWVEGDLVRSYLKIGNACITDFAKGRVEGVDESTICQYTGLTDKNGNKIWENDVVKKVDSNALGYHRERICTVSFDRFGYWKVMTTLGDGYWIGEFDEEQIEVIGNIFDNPELLGV